MVYNKSTKSKSRSGGHMGRMRNLKRFPDKNRQETKSGAFHKRPDVLRIIPLGGLEEVGRNMTAFEYENDIIIVDAGLGFPGEDMPGIDYVIPNTSYLKENKDKIRGLFITHAHLDHVGAIPYIMEDMGNPPIWTTPLSRGIILKRQDEFPHVPKLEIHIINKDDKKIIDLGNFKVENFHVNHNIPDSIGLAIHTPVGIIVHTCDFKFDFTPIGDKPADIARIAQIGAEGVKVLLSDSTNAENPGHSISEKTIMENLEEIFKVAKGKIIAATFSSLIMRIQQLIMLAEKYDRKVAIEGYGMKMNVELAKQLQYIKAEKGTLIDTRSIDNYPPNKILIVCTGAQGEDRAALMRIANREHRFVKITKGDSVIFSSSVIPGNERSVQFLRDIIARQGARVYHYKMMDIHAGGHAQADDLKLMINLMHPEYLMPIHGQYYMLRAHADLAENMGMPEQNILIAENGQVIEIGKSHAKVTQEKVPSNYVMVDGLGIGDIDNVVMRDRQILAQDGMVVAIIIIDTKKGVVRHDPDIISRGFVYMKESTELLTEVKRLIKEIVEKSIRPGERPNVAYVRDNIRDDLGKFLFQKIERRPMILPFLIEV